MFFRDSQFETNNESKSGFGYLWYSHQILALSFCAKTVKSKYDNRAHKILSFDLTTGKCQITLHNQRHAVIAKIFSSDFHQFFCQLK